MAGIEMWFLADVAKLLAAVERTQMSIMAYVPSTTEANAYRAGCVDTLAAIAAGFGLPSSNPDFHRDGCVGPSAAGVIMGSGGYN